MARFESYRIMGGADEAPFVARMMGSPADGTQRPVNFALEGAFEVEVYLTSLKKASDAYDFEGTMKMPPEAEVKVAAVSGTFNPTTHSGILRVPR